MGRRRQLTRAFRVLHGALVAALLVAFAAPSEAQRDTDRPRPPREIRVPREPPADRVPRAPRDPEARPRSERVPRSPQRNEAGEKADRGPRDAREAGSRLWEMSSQERSEMREAFRNASGEERKRMRDELFRGMLPLEREQFREQMILDRASRQRVGRFVETLSEDARAGLHREFGQMSREERRGMHEQMRAMEPGDRRALRDKLRHYQSLTDSEQKGLRDSLAELRSFDADERELIDSNAKRFREKFSESEREKLRRAWQRLKGMDSKERNHVLDQLLEDRGPEP